MSISLGLSVGEAFAELAGWPASIISDSSDSANTSVPPHRWYLPRRNLTEGLRDVLAARAADGGEIAVVTAAASFALAKRLGSTPAFLVTTGFEPWLALQTPLASSAPTAHPKRALSPLTDDHVFGISERTKADGTIEAAVSLEDLQFLATKLELLKTRTIAAGLLHSDLNPENERRIRDFFRERGFQVFCSHEFVLPRDTGGELSRWSRTVHSAYAWTALCEQKQQIEEALGEHKEKWTIRFATAGEKPVTEVPGFATAFGSAESLALWARAIAPKASSILHLGLDRFQVVRLDTATAPTRDAYFPRFESVAHRRLNVQPATPIELGGWRVPVLGEVSRGFEQSPMAFGKAHRPTAFDILFALGRIENIEGVTPLLQEKSRARVLESLFTLSKDTPSPQSVDPLSIAKDLETAILERIHQDLIASGATTGEILLCGALARSLHPRLEARRPDLRFKLAADAEFAEARAAAALTEKARGA